MQSLYYGMRNKLFLVFTTVLLVFSFTGGLSAADSPQKIIVQTPPTAGALPLIWMKENGIMADEIEIEIIISPDHQRAISLISQNEVDMILTGVNVGARAFNKGINIRLVNTNIWGIDYLLTSGFRAESWSDLKGKTLSLPLMGGPLDFLARYFLLENGVDPDSVEFVYMPSNNGAMAFQMGQLDAIILPEPMVTITLANYEDAYLSFDIQEEWAKIHNGENRIPFVGLFASWDFAEKNSRLLKKINEYYQKGIEWVHANPEEAAGLAAEYFRQPAPVIQASFQRINLNYYPAGEAYQLIELYFNEIMKIYPEMIGGSLPDELFYFQDQ